MRDIAPLIAITIMALFTAWLIRTLLENKRWSRVMAVNAETHTRMLQRLETSQDLLAYVQSEAGRQLLGSAPLGAGLASLQAGGVAGRALSSLQAGIVLGLGGSALLALRNSVENGHDPLLVIGSAGLAVGVGFILSALVSIWMGRHLGLMPKSLANEGR